MDILCILRGHRDFGSVIEVIDLQIGRLFWSIHVGLGNHMSSSKQSTFSSSGQKDSSAEEAGETARGQREVTDPQCEKVSVHCCLLWRWKKRANSRGVWFFFSMTPAGQLARTQWPQSYNHIELNSANNFNDFGSGFFPDLWIRAQLADIWILASWDPWTENAVEVTQPYDLQSSESQADFVLLEATKLVRVP